MYNNHERKVIPNLILGILLVSIGTFLIAYDIRSKLPQIDKNIIALGIVVVINAGLYFWGIAFIHKIKADLIRKQKIHREKEAVQEL